MLREPLPVREIFKRMCLIEIQTLKKNMTAIEAKVHYNDMISLHVQFIQNQMKLIELYQDEDEFDYIYMFDSIQQKAVNLAIILKNIFQSHNDDSISSSNNFRGNQTYQNNRYEFLSPEQRLFVKMIESLQWNNDICPAEVEDLLIRLGIAYESFVCNQQNTAHCIESDSDFERQLEISSDIQQKVISVETKLRKIIASEVTKSERLSSESRSSTESVETVIRLENPANESYDQSNTIKSSDLPPSEQRQFLRKIEWLDRNNNPSPAEAESLLNHLESAYDTFFRNQLNIVHCHCPENDPDFEKQLQIFTKIQRKMIDLKTRWNNIIKLN